MPMIAIKIPEKIADRLSREAVPGKKCPPEEMHLTLFYFKELKFEEALKVIACMHEVLKKSSSIKINLKKIVSFPSNEDGTPVIVPIISDDLIRLREKLAKKLDEEGLEYSKKYPEFKPHVTLSYSTKDVEERKLLSPFTFKVDEVILYAGKDMDSNMIVTIPFQISKAASYELLTDFFFKSAAYQWEEGTEWVPEKFKELEVFKQVDNPEKVFASFGLNDFIVKVDKSHLNKGDYKQDVLTAISYHLGEIIQELNINLFNDILADEKDIIVYYRDLCENLKAEVSINGVRISKQINQYEPGANVIEIYQEIFNQIKYGKLKNLSINIKPFRFDDYRTFDKGEFYLIFSTKASDLAGIASRGIQSCQSLFDKECTQITQHNKQLAGTILSKYIGVCYLTSKKDFQGRGWRMLNRALVRKVLDAKTFEPAIFIDEMYPVNSEQVYKMMQREISARTTVPVFYDPDKKFYSEEYEENIPTEYMSYKDNPASIQNYSSILNLARSPLDHVRVNAAKKLKISDLRMLKEDKSPEVREVVAERLPAEEISDMIGDQSIKVKIQLARRAPPDQLHRLVDQKQEHNIPVLEILLERLPLDQINLLKYVAWIKNPDPGVKRILSERGLDI